MVECACKIKQQNKRQNKVWKKSTFAFSSSFVLCQFNSWILFFDSVNLMPLLSNRVLKLKFGQSVIFKGFYELAVCEFDLIICSVPDFPFRLPASFEDVGSREILGNSNNGGSLNTDKQVQTSLLQEQGDAPWSIPFGTTELSSCIRNPNPFKPEKEKCKMKIRISRIKLAQYFLKHPFSHAVAMNTITFFK